MFTVLYLTVVIIFSTFISTEIKSESHRKGVRIPSLDGKVSNQHLLFQTDVSSKLACASTCMKHGRCVAFSTSSTHPPSKKAKCRCHDSRDILQNSTVVASGYKTYLMEDKPLASTWLERSCTTKNDCPATKDNVVCYSGQCLCQPGYFFSHNRDGCVSDCLSQDLQPHFIKYVGQHIQGNNMEKLYDCNTAEIGQTHCRQNPLCRTVDVSTRSAVCRLQSVTALDVPSSFESTSFADHYQRTCA